MTYQVEVYDLQQKCPGRWTLIEVENLEDTIEIIYEHLYDEKMIYDCDMAGWRKYYYVIRSNGIRSYLKFTHEYYFDFEEREVINDFYHEFVEPKEILVDYPKKNRDWIKT